MRGRVCVSVKVGVRVKAWVKVGVRASDLEVVPDKHAEGERGGGRLEQRRRERESGTQLNSENFRDGVGLQIRGWRAEVS